MAHSNVSLLSGNDIFLDGLNKSDVVQCTMQNNLKTWLCWITTGGEGLGHEMVVIMLIA
jgi:hypothetical protein